MSRRSAPARLRVPTGSGTVEYVRVDDHHARLREGAARGEPPVPVEEARFDVQPGRAPKRARASELGVVYRLGERGSFAVATGAVLVRFREGVAASRRAAGLARAGFAIQQVLAWAPHCAWVRAASGRAADALAGLDRLRGLPDVEAVEPQLLMARQKRE